MGGCQLVVKASQKSKLGSVQATRKQNEGFNGRRLLSMYILRTEYLAEDGTTDSCQARYARIRSPYGVHAHTYWWRLTT